MTNKMVALSIEYGSDPRFGDRRYGAIHRSDCPQLIDGEPIGEADNYSDACELADASSSWALNEGVTPTEYGYQTMPCTGFPEL